MKYLRRFIVIFLYLTIIFYNFKVQPEYHYYDYKCEEEPPPEYYYEKDSDSIIIKNLPIKNKNKSDEWYYQQDVNIGYRVIDDTEIAFAEYMINHYGIIT